jgi:hypothetical protein
MAGLLIGACDVAAVAGHAGQASLDLASRSPDLGHWTPPRPTA